MRLKSVFRMVLDGIPLLLIAAALILSVFGVGYLLIYKVIMKGKKKLKLSKVLWLLLLISYLGVLSFITVLRPGGAGMYGKKVYPLFYSYKSAWISFNYMEWRNLILNIAMFVPFGFLLPMTFQFFRSFRKTYAAGFLVTVGIECSQLIFGLGVVECDDVLNNFLGAMIGYGLYAIVCLIGDLIKKRRHVVWKTLALQLPFLVTVIAFSVVFTVYNGKELGNLRVDYIEPVTGFEIISHKEYKTETNKAMVYKAGTLDRDEADRMAEEFLGRLSDTVDERRNDYYDETALYYSKNSRSIWIDYVGTGYSFTDFNVGFGNEEIAVEKNATEEEILDALNRYGVPVPKETEFSTTGDGVYYITVTQSLENQRLYDGVIRCTYYKNGVMGNISNYIIAAEPHREFELISEQEAYEKICNGQMRLMVSDTEKVSIALGDVHISYMLDTKGFYQPVYSFDATAGDRTFQIEVPAVKRQPE